MKKQTKIHYDRQQDILYIVIKSGPEEYAEEVAPLITVEYDKNDKPIGIEIFKASELLGREFIDRSKRSSQTA